MHMIPLITLTYVQYGYLYMYHIYLYRSPGVYFLKMILTHLNQSGIYFFLVTWMQVPVLVLVWLEAITFIKLWIPPIDEMLQVHSA